MVWNICEFWSTHEVIYLFDLKSLWLLNSIDSGPGSGWILRNTLGGVKYVGLGVRMQLLVMLGDVLESSCFEGFVVLDGSYVVR